MTIMSSTDVLLAPFLFTAISFSIFLLCCAIFLCTRDVDETELASILNSHIRSNSAKRKCQCQQDISVVTPSRDSASDRLVPQRCVVERNVSNKSLLDLLGVLCGNRRRRERRVEDRCGVVKKFLATPSDEYEEPEVLL